MRTLVLLVAVLAGCGEVTETMGEDAKAEAPPTCAAPDKVTGRAEVATVTADELNPTPCYTDSWNSAVGRLLLVPFETPLGGYNIAVTGATASQTPTACMYHWTLLVTETVLVSYTCKWTTTVDLTTAPQ